MPRLPNQSLTAYLAERLRQLRSEKGWSQDDLARRAREIVAVGAGAAPAAAAFFTARLIIIVRLAFSLLEMPGSFGSGMPAV